MSEIYGSIFTINHRQCCMFLCARFNHHKFIGENAPQPRAFKKREIFSYSCVIAFTRAQGSKKKLETCEILVKISPHTRVDLCNAPSLPD